MLAATAALGLAYSKLHSRFLGGAMDGTAWEIRVKPDALLAFGRDDTLVFSQGQITVAGWLSSGFEPAVYEAQPLDGNGEAVFNAVLTHGEKGVMNWQGLVRGDSIQGIAVLWGRDGRSQRFVFRGTRKTAA